MLHIVLESVFTILSFPPFLRKQIKQMFSENLKTKQQEKGKRMENIFFNIFLTAGKMLASERKQSNLWSKKNIQLVT